MSHMDMRVSRVWEGMGVTFCIPRLIFKKAACTFDLDENMSSAGSIVAGAKRKGSAKGN